MPLQGGQSADFNVVEMGDVGFSQIQSKEH